MLFKSIAALAALLVSVTVLAVPLPDAPSDDIVYFFARFITVAVSARPDGDYARLAAGRPATPAALAPGCGKKDKADWKKADKKCTEWDDLHTEFTTVVSPRVVAALTAAEHTLNLVGHIDAHVKSSYHLNAAHDDLSHWTFTFTAPICAGECTGHAYDGAAPRHARIWNAHHAMIFNA